MLRVWPLSVAVGRAIPCRGLRQQLQAPAGESPSGPALAIDAAPCIFAQQTDGDGEGPNPLPHLALIQSKREHKQIARSAQHFLAKRSAERSGGDRDMKGEVHAVDGAKRNP